MDEKGRLEFGKWLLERQLGWISAADAKVAAVITLDTAALGGLAAAFSASQPPRSAWCYLAITLGAVGMIVALGCAALAAMPRTDGPPRSMIFFGRIKSDYSAPDFVVAFDARTPKEWIDDVATQIHRNAEIAAKKHHWTRRSIMWSFAAAAPLIAAVALLVKT